MAEFTLNFENLSFNPFLIEESKFDDKNDLDQIFF